MRLFHFLIAICLLLSGSVLPARSESAMSLKERLWHYAHECYSLRDAGTPGQDDGWIIDEHVKRGYLHVSGEYPTCGCTCSSTVGAFLKKNGGYLILKYEAWNCDWKTDIAASEPLSDVLPVSFGYSSFLGHEPSASDVPACFYAEAIIPKKGTDLLLRIRPVPFGMSPRDRKYLSFSVSESSSNLKSFSHIKSFVERINDDGILQKILEGNCHELDPGSLQALEATIEAFSRIYDDPVTMESFREDLRTLHLHYLEFERLAYDTVLLGWDREKEHFFIKDQRKERTNGDFLDYLKKNSFWEPIC